MLKFQFRSNRHIMKTKTTACYWLLKTDKVIIYVHCYYNTHNSKKKKEFAILWLTMWINCLFNVYEHQPFLFFWYYLSLFNITSLNGVQHRWTGTWIYILTVCQYMYVMEFIASALTGTFSILHVCWKLYIEEVYVINF